MSELELSDRAKAQVAKIEAKEAAGERVGIADLVGIWELKRPITVRCICCGLDAGEDVGGEPCANGHPYCSLCVGREHNDADCSSCRPPSPSLAVAIEEETT